MESSDFKNEELANIDDTFDDVDILNPYSEKHCGISQFNK